MGFREDVSATSAIVSMVFICLLVYLLYKQIVFIIDENGITIKRWNHVRYFLPWEEIQSVGLQKGYRETLVLYVSRYDSVGTTPLISHMLRFDNMESLPFTINNAVFGRKGKKKSDEAPILILNVSSCGTEYNRLLKYYYSRTRQSSIE